MLQKTTAQTKIAKLKTRVRIVQGGTSSSKTFTIIPFLIQYAIYKKGSEISIVSESIPHLKRGAIRDFLKVMQWTGNYYESQWNKSSHTYTFKNGSFIEFFSADQPDKLRGARRDVLFINECNNIDFESYQQLSIRTRKFIYLDYNPTSTFWVNEHLLGNKDVSFVILTYKDNEALEASIVKAIESAREKAKTSKYWENWWKVYGLGQIGTLEGVIFNNWQQIDNIPPEAKLIGSGMDFGFTNDPTTLISLYKYNNEYIFHEVLYKKGLTNREIYQYAKGVQGHIIADSAEPKSIHELLNYGLIIQGAAKGSDSILHGIQLLQSIDFKVTSSSTNLIKELRNYAWDKNKTGKQLNLPIDAYCHCIDAMRYVASKFLTKQTATKSFGSF